MRPFADGVADYALAGWPCVLPVPVVEKFPPPVGFTGENGRDTDALQLVRWAGEFGHRSIAIRMPDGVIGIDVDHYIKGTKDKRGNDSLTELVARWGPLPPTWSSTARGGDTPGPSRIMFFRAPTGRYVTKVGDAIEIIQRHHRYAVVAPSTNPLVERAYQWYGPDGAPCGPPKPEELPELPETWVAGLREGAADAGPVAAPVGAGQDLLAVMMADQRPECAEVTNARRQGMATLAGAESGSRHDTATGRVHHLVQLGAAGHPGVGGALVELRGLWEALTTGEGRGGEFDLMALTSARKAVTVVGTSPVDRDPCFSGGERWTVPAPGGETPVPGLPVTQPAWSIREVIGSHLFDPRDDLDHGISAAALHRMWPVLRYAADARAWLLRGPDRWVIRKDVAAWAVHDLAELMPRGDSAAEKGSAEERQAARRKRLMTNAGRNAVASTMTAAVMAGTHPCSLELSDLDSDPYLLWAGGVAWDLAASADGPVASATTDPGTPHLHSAPLAPAPVPTPLWDAFLSAVWPDPEVRAWALRVLSIALTGEPDAALPILLGPERRGKSQVVHLLMSILGSYAVSANPKLLSGQDNAHDSIYFALMGARLAFVDEGPRGGAYAQERLKQLTGGTALTGNAMRMDPVVFDPTHTLILTANDEPSLTDPAVRARVRLIPCEGDENAVRAARRPIGRVGAGRRGFRNFSAAWLAEAPGVLWHMMREAGRWLADRDSALTSAAPGHIRDRASLIAAEQDVVAQWLSEMCEPYKPGTRAGMLHEQFVAWCRNNGVKDSARPTLTRWGRRLTDLGFPPEHRRDGRYRQLRVTAGSAFGASPVLPEASTTAGPAWGHVTGSGIVGDGLATGFEGNPQRHETTGQTHNSNTLVEGVDGLVRTSTLINKKQDHKQDDLVKNKITGEIGSLVEPATPTPQETTPDQEKRARDGAPAGPSPNPPPSQAIRRVNPVTGRYTKATAREAEKVAARLVAAGESVSLPVVVERGSQRRIVSLTPAEACGSVADLLSRAGGALTVDVETTGYALGHADYALRTVQLGDERAAVVFDPSDPVQADVIRAALAAAPRLHAHSATADLVPLVHAGLTDESAWDRMYDTVIPAKLADPSSTGSDPGLKQLATAVLGEHATAPAADEARATLFKTHGWLTDVKLTTPCERSGWAQVDPTCTTMIRYAASDVLDTAALATRLPLLPPDLLERERAVQRITARVAHRGLRIDYDRVKALCAEHEPALAAAGELVRAMGVDNPGSDQQLAQRLSRLGVVLPRTKPSKRHPEGQPSVAAGVLEGMRGRSDAAGELIQAVLAYRHHETVLSTFLGPYRVLCEFGDGRARPTVYTLGTDTGRMSCVRPNLQQLPRQGGVRASITADPGYQLISADFSGVEIRVMAALSQDPTLIRILREGGDLHAMVAEQAFGPEWTKADRYTAKRGVFGWAYGGGVGSLARQVGVPEHVMAAIVDSLQLVAPLYVAWADQVKQSVRRGATQMPTYTGRTIHLPREYPHKGPNFCIQGTARELLVDALVAWDQTRWAGSTVLPVHDEIIAMVPEADAAEATEALVQCMTRELYGIPIIAEASKPSFAWQDAV